jgi:phospholipid/cholesterol/gamma-HCH transport system substrate-binding protein
MEADARYTWVGAGVLALVAALVAGLLWLQDVGGEGNAQRFAIDFEEQALDGLEIGGAVLLRGIKVGRVEAIQLSESSTNRVRVGIRVDGGVPVHVNTAAVITRNFVTGIAAVTLVTGTPAGPRLTEVPKGERVPLIAEGRSDLQEIAGRVNKVGEMASVALNNLNQLIDKDNREALTTTLHNLRVFSDGLNDRLPALDRTLAQAGRAADAFDRAAAGLSEAGARIAATVERGGEGVDRTLGEADATLVATRAALQQLTTTADALQAQVAGTSARLEDAALRVDDQLGAALADLRLSLEATTRVVDRLRDPRGALLGPAPSQLGPGEVKP